MCKDNPFITYKIKTKVIQCKEKWIFSDAYFYKPVPFVRFVHIGLRKKSN